ncbi:tyrosine-type recombinase/integrase [Desulfosporosinus sp. SYSU MS00001]|uniref:tyrosine-type recombinase/integrase n=1 Tax=Desulfosporosinus sp. SYSU MS00001 TaxID=3416284 RepID=UPI003CF3633E
MNKQATLIFYLARKSSRFSINTLSTYEKRISDFLESTDHELSEIVIDDYLEFEANKLMHGTDRSTLSTTRAACKSLINFALEEDVLAFNPLKGLRRTKLKKAIPRYLDDATVDGIKDAAKYNLRDSAIIHTLLVTGVRVSELIEITKSDCDMEHRQIHIRKSKDLEERMVPITPTCRERIERYINTRNDNAPYLFVNSKGGKISRQGVLYIVKQYAEMSGAKVNVTVHSFRHTFAHKLSKAGAPLEFIAKLLGHTRLDMARRYTGPTK